MKDYQNKELLTTLYEKHKSAYKIASELNCNKKTIYNWMKKFGIKPGDKTQGARKYTCNHSYFSVIDNSGKAYWLGFLMADGCVYEGDSKNSYRLQINLAAVDKEMLIAFNKAICSDYNICDKYIGKSPVSQLKINSTEMCNDLINLGVVPRKSMICRLPKIESEYYRHFMRGYFEGDGCISGKGKRWEVSIVSGSKGMADDIKSLLDGEGIHLSVRESLQKPGIYTMRTSKHEMLFKFYCYLYERDNFYMRRKKEKYKQCLSLISVPLCRNAKQ